MKSPFWRSHWSASAKTSCRPAGTVVVNVPLPLDPRASRRRERHGHGRVRRPAVPERELRDETHAVRAGDVDDDRHRQHRQRPVRVHEPVERARVAVHGVDLAGVVLAEAREGVARLQELLRLPAGRAVPQAPDAPAAVVRVEVDPVEPREVAPAVDEAARDRAVPLTCEYSATGSVIPAKLQPEPGCSSARPP